MKKPFSILFLLALLAVGCKKSNVTVPAKKSTLYFAGADGNKAVYWENGVEHTLPSTKGAEVRSISISGSDVYFTGYEGPGTEVSYPGPAVYWKSGVKYTIPYLNSVMDANGDNYLSLDLVAKIAFSGTYMFIGGTHDDRAVDWINGVEEMQPTIDSNFPASYVNDMVLSGPDLYLAGYDGGQHVPAYWRSGVETVLPVADTLKLDPLHPLAIGEVNRIYVSGPDVYCAGWDGWTLVYWKNGSEHTLPVINKQTTSTSTGVTLSIAVSGSDLYITGNDGNSAVYWKNGVETKLPSSGTASAAGIVFIGTDVYIVGSDTMTSNRIVAVYWKNGTEINLPSVDPAIAIGLAIAVENQ